MQDRGLEVVRGDDIVGGAVADLVGAAAIAARPDSAAGEQIEALAVVVSSCVVVEVPSLTGSRADLRLPSGRASVSRRPRLFQVRNERATEARSRRVT